MHQLSRLRTVRTCALTAIVLLAVGLSSCDSTHPNEITGQVFIQGAVTAADGHANPGIDGTAGIEGATVRAEEVMAQGVLGELWGSAMSDTESEFILATQPTGNVVIITAEREDFRAAIMLEEGVANAHGAEGFIHAPPMSLESTTEADVLIQARRQSPHILVADVSALVGVRAGNGIADGGTTVVKLASGIVAGALAEMEYARRPNGGAMTDVMVAAARDERREAFSRFRTDLTNAATIEARMVAVQDFQRRYGRAMSHVGLSPSKQAQASIAAAGGIDRFAAVVHPRARYGSLQGALEIAVVNTASSVETSFLAAGAPAARLATLSHARGTLINSVRQANTLTEFEAALNTYRQVIELELAGEMNLPMHRIDDAFEAVLLPRNALRTALSSSADAHAIADAYVAYFSSAREAVIAQLGTGSEIAADIIPLIAAF